MAYCNLKESVVRSRFAAEFILLGILADVGGVMLSICCVSARPSGRVTLSLKLIAVVLCTSLAACGVTRDQLDAVGAFGKSASTLANSVKDAYAQADQNEVDLRLAQQIASVSTSDPAVILRAYGVRRFDLSAKKIKGRLAAAEALSAYGVALATLLDSKTQDSDFSDAATSLTAASRGCRPPAQRGITGDEVAGVGAVVVAFGKIALDIRRREVIEQVVPAAEPVVTKICLLFGRDFDVNRSSVGGIVKSEMIKSIDDIKRVFTAKDVTNGRDADSGATMQNRAVLLPLYEKLWNIKTKSLAAFADINDAAQGCAKASKNLAAVVKDPKVTLDDIIDFAKKAQAAFDAVKSLSGSKAG